MFNGGTGLYFLWLMLACQSADIATALRVASQKTKTFPVSNSTVPRDQDCKQLATLLKETTDFDECMERSGDYVFNNHCSSIKSGVTIPPEYSTNGSNITIGIITVDDRARSVEWDAYASKHGYTYIHVRPPNNGQRSNMEKDWTSTEKIEGILDDPHYQHISHFMYTELDQWPVHPMAKLEPVFAYAGLVGPARKKMMAVVGEYPCDDIRNGGRFNMGNFLFVRDHRMKDLLHDWKNSHAYHEGGDIMWPARQGAFSVEIYDKYKDAIFKFKNADPLGSPFGTLIGHVTGGDLAKTYNPHQARNKLHIMHKCVFRRLKHDDTRPCSYYPTWIGGTCLICRGSIQTKGQRFPYTGCCGEVDRALPMEAFQRLAESGLITPNKEVDLASFAAIDE
eukprot:TRINITY_DN50657_c0_g1_i1.p1 TRINITY_DN50657_c0_g1~~TRINITY_DN50657_c0_g1_i1.p1  ORF type:complete len:394 (-),score=32.95 TRINITY_DN50657_c0_g1_i1:29-1210(-)